MRALLQRVTEASVTVDDEVVGAIGPGLLALVGVAPHDTVEDAEAVARKIWDLRLFPGPDGRPEHPVGEVGGQVLVVSQFTLYGDTRKGRRPSWQGAAPPEVAEPLVEAVVRALRERGATVATGRFGAHMSVALVNDGPVTLLVEVPPPDRGR